MEIITNSLQEIIASTKVAWHVLSYVWLIILPPTFFFLFKELWMYHIQLAFWASPDWVVLEIIPPKEIEKSPKLMEALYAGFAGAEKSFSVIDEFMDGAFPDYMSLELVSDAGIVHFYIRTMKKYRHLVEAYLYSQYPDTAIIEVPDYVDDVPKIAPNTQWDVWGADIAFTAKHDAYPIRTYQKFEETVTGKMIDPLAGLIEIMGKAGPGQRIWIQWIIAPTSPAWSGTVGKKLADKLKGREVKEVGILERIWQDIKDIFANLIPALSGPVEFPVEKKKEEQPLEFRLSPGERDTLKAVEDNLGKLQFSTKGRVVLVGRRENFDKSFVSAIWGGLKQFGDDNANGFKPDGDSKTSALYWFAKERLRYKQRKIFRRYKSRSRDGLKIVMSSEELATVYHLPDMSVMAPSMSRIEAKRGGAPSNLPIE